MCIMYRLVYRSTQCRSAKKHNFVKCAMSKRFGVHSQGFLSPAIPHQILLDTPHSDPPPGHTFLSAYRLIHSADNLADHPREEEVA